MRRVVCNIQFVVADCEAGIAVVAGAGENGIELETTVFFNEPEPGFTVDATASEDFAVRKVNEVRTSQRRPAVDKRPVGIRGFGGSKVRAAVASFTTYKDLHLATWSESDGCFVWKSRDVQLCYILIVNAVGRLDKENLPVGAGRLINHAVADAVAPCNAPEPV